MSFGYQVLGFGAFPNRGPDSYQPAGALMFDGSADFLTRNPTSYAAGQKTFTISAWIKKNDSADYQSIISATDATTATSQFGFGTSGGGGTDNLLWFYNTHSNVELRTSAQVNGTSGWFHALLAVDTTQGTNTNRVKIYLNGVQLTLTPTNSNGDGGYPVVNEATKFCVSSTFPHRIGSYGGIGAFLNAYVADFAQIYGTAYTPDSFGETNSSGIWVPKDISGLTWSGTNSAWLDFSNGADIGNDVSGNNNDFTPISIDANNIAVDGPANSTDKEISIHPTIDPVGPWGVAENTLSNNNLTWVSGGSSNKWNYSTMPISNTDKVYFEVHQSGNCGGSHTPGFSITKRGHPGGDTYPGAQTDESDWGFYLGNGSNTTAAAQVRHDNVLTLNNQAGGADGDVYQVARDGASLWFGRNNTWYNSGDPTDSTTGIYKSGSNPLPTDEPLWVAFHSYGTQATLTWKPYSTGWTYSPPSGFGEMKSTVTGLGNAATLNALSPSSGTLSNGNLSTSLANYNSFATGTIPMTSGKWYWEANRNASGSQVIMGIADPRVVRGTDPWGSAYIWAMKDDNNGDLRHNNTNYGSGQGWNGTVYSNASDVVSVAYDADNAALYFAVNGTWVNGTHSSASVPTSGSSKTGAFTTNLVSGNAYIPFFGSQVNATRGWDVNFGQTPFTYSMPSGYTKLSTQNLAEPTVTDPSAYFGTMTWAGNATARNMTSAASTAGAIEDASGAAWTPDFVWIKESSDASDHALFDRTRTNGTRALRTSNSTAEDTDATAVTGLISGGVALGDNSTGSNATNRSSQTYVGWFLKAGGSPSDDSSGGITVSRTTADHQGFSICKGTKTSGTKNFAHGLGAKPEFVIVRDMDDASQHWQVQHKDVNANMADITTLSLNRTNAAGSSSNWWGGEPTPTLQYISDNHVSGSDASPNDFVAYLFRRIPGLIGIGSYVGNGDPDGPNVVIDDGGSGFKPAFVLIKAVNRSNNWHIFDSVRDPFNQITNSALFPDSAAAEGGTNAIDFVSNGFKLRTDQVWLNASSSNNYIYLAFAESPFGLNNRAR